MAMGVIDLECGCFVVCIVWHVLRSILALDFSLWQPLKSVETIPAPVVVGVSTSSAVELNLKAASIGEHTH